ncbi:hypothetical protein [Curtobacterium sp. ISL-83]|uniref:hypothetical protein n=1 Tax=Curtobacterium sp. ISL-83 TaxID=2819145 RepID=UPI001BEB1F6D|nr:hypothetical protein [Curtobacterium sp. ISL-83]MBT2501985.1 hypothetical protein [Curtobacterium sp. ISL-83]
MDGTSARRRKRSADVIAVIAVVVSLWAPIAVVLETPLAVAAGAAGVTLSTFAGIIDRENARAPAAFLVVLGIIATALALHWAST